MNNNNRENKIEKIFAEIIEAIDNGCYKKIGTSDILVGFEDGRESIRVDELIFAGMLADDPKLYKKFTAKLDAARERRYEE